MTDTSHRDSYRLAVATAVVAGALALTICALLLYDYSRRLAKDPLDSAAYKTLVAALDAQPTNQPLKDEIRTLDVELRREYFRQRKFVHVGVGLLLASLVVFLMSAKTAATLRRHLPKPTPGDGARDAEAAWTRTARFGVVAVAALLASLAIALAVSVRSPLDEDREQLAALLGETPVGWGKLAPASAGKPSPSAENHHGGPALATRVGPTLQSPAAPAASDWARMWPRFRGPDGSGVSAYTNVPESWDAKSGKNIRWKVPLPLPGNNSPVVWGKRVFLSGADERRREVYSFDADSGKLLWRQDAPGTPQSTARLPKVESYTGYAASTTATDGRHVVAIFANGDVASFDLDGKLAWSKSLGIPVNSYGHASSLTIWRGLVFVQFDQGIASERKSKLLAFDTASGKPAWQVARPVANSWTSPIVIHHAGSDQLITASDPWVISYDPTTGTEIWRANCLHTDIGPSPTFADGMVVVGGQTSNVSAIRVDGLGDVTATHIVWNAPEEIDTCSPLVTKQFVLALGSEGMLTCYDAAKGNNLWADDLAEEFTASPSLVGNRVYLIAKSGKAFIVEPARDKCKRIGEADLGEECVTSPAFQDGRIYLRGKDHLFCIGK